MPSVGKSNENTDDDPRANRRPIKPIDSPAFHRSQISRPLGCWIIAVAADDYSPKVTKPRSPTATLD